MNNKKLLATLIISFFTFFISGFFIGQQIKQKYVYDRCMKYFGDKGYPMSHYCKLFIGEIKARDEE